MSICCMLPWVPLQSLHKATSHTSSSASGPGWIYSHWQRTNTCHCFQKAFTHLISASIRLHNCSGSSWIWTILLSLCRTCTWCPEICTPYTAVDSSTFSCLVIVIPFGVMVDDTLLDKLSLPYGIWLFKNFLSLDHRWHLPTIGFQFILD